MRVVFTICAVNYLASARALRQSLRMHSPEVKFIYIVADKIAGRIKADFFDGDDVVEVDQLDIPDLEKMISHYNITEFSTAIKPFAIQYINKKYECSRIIYFDPDILIFHSIDFIWNKLESYDFVLTPHILEPVTKDEFYRHQVGALNTGIFNLGFIGIHYNEVSMRIIEWWKKHMIEHGHSDSLKGEFYDQKIMNLLPAFSEKLHILKHPGCNMAGWNVHEREIRAVNGKYFVNGKELIFYHYSGFIEDANDKRISKYNELSVEEKPFMSAILDKYRTALKENKDTELKKFKCIYHLMPDIHRSGRFAVFTHKISKLFK